MRRIRWRGLVALAVVATLGGCGKREERASPAPPVVQPAPLAATNAPSPPTTGMVPTPVVPETVAELRGSEEMAVKATEPGYLARQVYKENALVAAGDALFFIDPRPSHPDMGTAQNNDTGLLKVVAPVGGAVGRAVHGAGDRIEANETLTTVSKIDSVVAEFKLADAKSQGTVLAFGKILSRPMEARSADFELILPDGSIYPKRGVITGLFPSGVIDDGGHADFLVTFPNPDHVLRPGEFVKVRTAP